MRLRNVWSDPSTSSGRTASWDGQAQGERPRGTDKLRANGLIGKVGANLLDQSCCPSLWTPHSEELFFIDENPSCLSTIGRRPVADSMTPPSFARSVFTLLAGGAAAQVLPLLIGPWLTRLFTPSEFGAYHLFAAVAANVAVVACARYELALPVARDETEANTLLWICARVLAAVVGLTCLGTLGWMLWAGSAWMWALPLAVCGLGAVSVATMQATRAQRFQKLAWARVAQYSGSAVLQLSAGLLQLGLQGLIVAPVLATLAAVGLLVWPRASLAAFGGKKPLWREVARRYQDFPLLNTPHAFLGALLDTVCLALIVAWAGPAAAGAWGLSLRYLKVSQVLYPRLAAAEPASARKLVRHTMVLLLLMVLPWMALLWFAGPWLFVHVFGAQWQLAGELSQALALYIGLHFVASPLSVVTMAWGAQGWALKLAVVGQIVFVAALGLGLHLGGLTTAAWAVSGVMAVYFGYFFASLWIWPLTHLASLKSAAA
jgi:O-antigen/teichoic acid export membrane protein